MYCSWLYFMDTLSNQSFLLIFLCYLWGLFWLWLCSRMLYEPVFKSSIHLALETAAACGVEGC